MGLLDLPAPLFAWIDRLVGGVLPAPARLAFWGGVGAILSMGLYWWLSPQARIASTKAKAVAARRALDAYEGDFAEAWPLLRRSLGLALRQVGLVIGPVLLASLPVLSLIVWLSTAFGRGFPAPDSDVDVRAAPDRFQARWVDGPRSDSPAPGRSPRIVVEDEAGAAVAEFALPVPVSVLHKREWWNAFVGNPAGYLPDEGALTRIEVDLPRREYVPFGPSWLRGWETVFLAALLAASLLLKIGFRIE